jgi:uncharacterized protein YjbI with pentapeptide repeats
VGRQKQRSAGITLGVVAVVITIGGVIARSGPNWSAIGTWLGTWWWLVLAVVVAATGGALLIHARPARTPSVVWERTPDQVGLLARSTPAQQPGRQVNWSAVTSLITAFTALAALVFTALSLSATRDQIAVSEQGQITDRYSTAITQLSTQGTGNLETRLGGIYALERLARDSPRDQPTIVEVLSAFIRTGLPHTTATDTGVDEQACPVVGSPFIDSPPTPVDVQAALTVLGRRDHTHDNGAVIDLHNACLPAADLDHADLHGANLREADLTGADLGTADLTDADLNQTDLTTAHLDYATLTRADISSAQLFGGYLDYANLDGADLQLAHLGHTDFGRADLHGANLNAADLTGAQCIGADLTNADLTSADLTNAIFVGADLTGATHDQDTVTLNTTKDDARGTWW